MNRWRPACNGSSKRMWFVCRVRVRDVEKDYHYDKRGYLIRYASAEAAERAAERLNRAEAA